MKETILLVDDDQEFREEFASCLDEYTVITTDTGAGALALLKKPNEIDLAILDVRMPGMDGINVLKEMRRIAPELSIVMLTGFSSKDMAIEALRAHADDFIEKPPDIEKTKSLISRLLSSKRNTAPAATSVDEKVEHLQRFAERNSMKKTALKDAAAAVFLSPKYASRLFKQATGTSFSEFRIALKMKEAQHLLKDGQLTVNQIAEKLGYQNTESFIRIFKKATRLTPAAYRVRHCRTHRLKKGR